MVARATQPYFTKIKKEKRKSATRKHWDGMDKYLRLLNEKVRLGKICKRKIFSQELELKQRNLPTLWVEPERWAAPNAQASRKVGGAFAKGAGLPGQAGLAGSLREYVKSDGRAQGGTEKPGAG